jgi:[protein-PII] uridylyltransferase
MSLTFEEIVAQSAVKSTPSKDLDRNALVQGGRAYALSQWSEIRDRHDAGESGTNVVHMLSDAADRVMTGAFNIALVLSPHAQTLRNRLCVCALGGYGRRELNPHSDLDLCLVYDGDLDDDVEEVNAFLMPFLWDLGFQVGYTVRSVPEACKLAEEDIRDFTSLWQARPIVGNTLIFSRLKLQIRSVQSSELMGHYIQRVIRSRYEDLNLVHADLYTPNPDIKENKGGLRDWHVGLWLYMLAYGASSLDEIASQGLIAEEEHLQVAEALDFIWRLRNELHFHANRSDDILTFANQQHAASAFGYSSGSSENLSRLMEDYYGAALRLRRFLRQGARTWNYDSAMATVEPHEAESAVRTANGGEPNADEVDPNWFTERPSRLMEVFWDSARRNTPLSLDTHQLVGRNLHLVTSSFKSSEPVRRFFVAICSKPRLAGSILREMHRSGLLEKYMPEVDAVKGIIRYEDFHSYPVDEHTIRAVEALAGVDDLNSPAGRCLAMSLDHLSRPHILVLAIIFHDLGKAAGDVHSEESERLTYVIGNRMGLPEGEIEHIAFLVRHHILMTHISQYRDIDDEDIVRSFAETMTTEQRLRELFILSYCDLSAVGPNVWNDWKGTLLMKLYLRAERILLGRADMATADYWKSEKAEAIRALIRPDLAADLESNLRTLGERYFSAFSADQIALHMECLAAAGHTGLAIHWNTLEEESLTEVVVCTADRPGRFVQMAGCFAAQLIDVNSAALFAGPAGLVLDSFTLTEARGGRPLTRGETRALEKVFKAVLLEGKDVSDEVNRADSRLYSLRKPSSTVRTLIAFDNKSSREYTVIDVETGDRTGLLFDIAQAIKDEDLDIATARIVTDARHVHDSFYVSSDKGKIETEHAQTAVREAVHKAIHPRATVESKGDNS